jgi:murein DD-endopeptidase MepM/ murein hydrolase activator NlpD
MLLVPWLGTSGQDSLALKNASIRVDPIDSLIRSRELSMTDPPSSEVCGHITSSDWNDKTPYITFSGRGSSIENSQLWREHREKFQTPVSGVFVRGFNNGHKGIDVALHMGDSVRSSWTGVVRYAGYDNGGYGKLVVVRHCNGLETWYAHLSALLVQPNQPVGKGTVVGLGGSTGRSTGPHLHFETRYMGKPMDPLRVIRSNNGSYEFTNSLHTDRDNSVSR